MNTKNENKMKSIIKYILPIFLLTFVGSLQAENIIHLDKPFYVAGETVWFSLFLEDDVQDNTSIQFKVVNRQNEVIHLSFVKTKNGIVCGYYKIPFDIPTGNYGLVFESKTIVAEHIVLGSLMVPFYNDLLEQELSNNAITLPSFQADISSELNIGIDLKTDQVLPGEIVSGAINITDGNGNPIDAMVSVSVFDAGIIGDASGLGVYHYQDDLTARDELVEQLFFEGKIYNDNDQPIRANVIGAYSQQEHKFSFTKSNDNGDFILAKDDFYGKRSVQFVGFQKEFPIIRTALTTEYPFEGLDSEVPYNPTIEQYLIASNKRKKINQYFNIPEKATMLSLPDINAQEIVTQANYNVKEYESFDNMENFAKNLMMPLRFKKEDGELVAQVINPTAHKTSNYFMEGQPIFLIDGKITRNATYIGKLAQEEVEDLSIIYDNKELRRQFNVLGSSGAVVINTFGRAEILPEEDERNIFEVTGIQVEMQYPIAFNATAEIEERPVFNPQVYWHPNLNISGTGNISYVQTNDKSVFKIVVVARSTDGRIGYATSTYSVGLMKN